MVAAIVLAVVMIAERVLISWPLTVNTTSIKLCISNILDISWSKGFLNLDDDLNKKNK